MKISAIQAIPLGIPMRALDPPSAWTAGASKQIIVRVFTDEGLTGYGEAFAYGAPLAVCNVIDESLAPLLLGQNALRIEALVDLMHRVHHDLRAPRTRHVRHQRHRDRAVGPPRQGPRRPAVRAARGRRSPAAPRLREPPPLRLPRRGGASVPPLRGPGLPHAEAPSDRRGVGARRPRDRRRQGGADARHELPVDSGRGHRHGSGPRPVPALLAGGTGVAARGLPRARRGGARHRHPDRARRERVHALRLPRDHRPRGRRHPAAERHQGRRDLRAQEDRRARPGREPAGGPAFLLRGAGAGRDPPRGGGHGRRHAGRVPHRPPRDVTAGCARSRPGTAWSRCPTGPGLGVEINEDAIQKHPYAPAAARPFVLR